MSGRRSKDDRHPDWRSRISVGLLYLIMSVPIGGWAARVPEVRGQLGATDPVWGLANTISGIGNVVGLCVIVLLAGRVSNRLLAPTGAVLVLATVPLMAFSTNLAAVILGLTTWALVAHIMDIPMGSMALEVQRRYARPVMGSFDACFGAGTLAGGGLGTLSAALGVPPSIQLGATSVALGTALIVTIRWLPEEADRLAQTRRVTLRARFNRRMLPIAAMALLAGYVSESIVLWSAIYVADTVGGGPVLGGLAYTAAATTATVALLYVDRATVAMGRIRLMRISTLGASIGFTICLLVASPAAALAGFVILAVGMACVNPTIYTFAGNQKDLSASEGVSVVEVGQMPGASILAPALIGALSGVVGLRAALGSIAVAAALLAVLVARVEYSDTPHVRTVIDQ